MRFAGLCHLLRDHLDVTTEFADDVRYVVGITEKAGGHAHVFDGFIDTSAKVLRGRTNILGQNKAKTMQEHNHPIWTEGVDMNANDVAGTTRDASAGASHTHEFSLGIRDSAENRGTLVAEVEVVADVLKLVDEKCKANSLTDDEKKFVVDGLDKVKWDSETYSAALRILPRVAEDMRWKVVQAMVDSGFMKDRADRLQETKDSNVDTKAIQILTDANDELKTKLADAVGLAERKESERKTLLDENVKLKAGTLSLKASLIVKADAKLKGETLTDAQVAERVTKLVAENADEKKLDELLDKTVLENVQKPAGEKVEKKATDLAKESRPDAAAKDAATKPAAKKDKKDVKPKDPRTLAAVDEIIDAMNSGSTR